MLKLPDNGFQISDNVLLKGGSANRLNVVRKVSTGRYVTMHCIALQWGYPSSYFVFTSVTFFLV